MKSIIKLLCLSLPVSMLLQIAQVQAKVNSQPDDAPSTGSVTQKNKQNLSDEE